MGQYAKLSAEMKAQLPLRLPPEPTRLEKAEETVRQVREVLAPVEKDSRGRKKGTNQTPQAGSKRSIASDLLGVDLCG